MATWRQIRELGRRITREFHPRKIVLFGSHVRGVASPDSDVDLLVVLSFRGHPVAKSVEIRMKTRPEFPVDLLVRTPGKIRQRLEMGDSFIRDILERGKVIYERDGR